MHELCRPGRRPARQIVHFTEENRIAPACGVARDAAAVDAAPDNREVENPIQRRFPGVRPFILAIWLSILSKSQPNTKAMGNADNLRHRPVQFNFAATPGLNPETMRVRSSARNWLRRTLPKRCQGRQAESGRSQFFSRR